MKPLEPARLEQTPHGLRSTEYDDIYGQPGRAIAEAEHVFLGGNSLPDRFRSARQFTIGELGFGIGLNFLVTRRLWTSCARDDATLHYIGIEKHPLTKSQLSDAWRLFPDLSEASAELIAQWPDLAPGVHLLRFDVGRVRLSLWFGDVAEMLPELSTKIDAWFLDGFAPSRNAAMWTSDVLRLVAERTNQNGTFATYSAASDVRTGLQGAGFSVERVSGHGDKKHMLRGRHDTPIDVPNTEPWFATPAPQRDVSTAIVIGAGLAGCAVSRALADRGTHVVVIDRNDVASGASRIPAALYEPLLSIKHDATSRIVTAAWRAARVTLESYSDEEIGRKRCGVLHVAYSSEEKDRFLRTADNLTCADDARWLSTFDACATVGFEIDAEGLFVPQAGVVCPADLCRAQLAHSNIEARTNCNVAAIRRADGKWTVQNDAGETVASAPVLVLASAISSRMFEPTAWTPLQPVRGQVTQVAANDASSSIRCAATFGGYCTLAMNGNHTIGATFDPNDSSDHSRASDNDRNIALLRERVPSLYSLIQPQTVAGSCAAVRAATPDRLPMIGAVPDLDFYRREYEEVRHGRLDQQFPDAQYVPGLYMTVGHGSRGVVTTQLAAELIASQVLGEPAPLEQSLVNALAPARFVIRALKRGEELGCT